MVKLATKKNTQRAIAINSNFYPKAKVRGYNLRIIKYKNIFSLKSVENKNIKPGSEENNILKKRLYDASSYEWWQKTSLCQALL